MLIPSKNHAITGPSCYLPLAAIKIWKCMWWPTFCKNCSSLIQGISGIIITNCFMWQFDIHNCLLFFLIVCSPPMLKTRKFKSSLVICFAYLHTMHFLYTTISHYKIRSYMTGLLYFDHRKLIWEHVYLSLNRLKVLQAIKGSWFICFRYDNGILHFYS